MRNGTRYRRKTKGAVFLWAVILIIAAILLRIGGEEAYRQVLTNSHPMRFQREIARFASESGVDVYLVYAVIKTESGFDQNATSNVGARGLMQIMEDTFEWIKWRFAEDGDNVTYDDMYTPDVNIRYGCLLLSYLTERYGDRDAAVAAYHAGVGSVDSWLADKNYSRDHATLSKIPRGDTAHYVDKINTAYKNYLYLYAEDKKNG